MLDKLRADFDGILELVQKAPAPLQETALKMILERWFATNGGAIPLPPPTATPPAPGAPLRRRYRPMFAPLWSPMR